MKCLGLYISKSKLAFRPYNKTYLSVIAFIVFTLHEIKHRKFFLGHPVYIYIYLIIYEIKYKTNVVTQSFMPEFTDNLRTTKVLLTKFNRLYITIYMVCMYIVFNHIYIYWALYRMSHAAYALRTLTACSLSALAWFWCPTFVRHQR
jgi:uncharacterized membrane protein YesL